MVSVVSRNHRISVAVPAGSIARQRKTALTRAAPLTFRNPLENRLSAKGNCNPKRNHAYQQGKLYDAWLSQQPRCLVSGPGQQDDRDHDPDGSS